MKKLNTVLFFAIIISGFWLVIYFLGMLSHLTMIVFQNGWMSVK